MVELKELMVYCDQLLNTCMFRDYAPNGLQVEGRPKVRKIVTGVTASLALIEAAVAVDADLVMVHHGYFWKGETPCLTGIKRQRIARLLAHDISLAAYHLPLDAHPELGNNARLAQVLDFSVEGRFGRDGDEVAMYGRLPVPMSSAQLADHIARRLQREPLHLPGTGDKIERIGWCSGAAQGYIEAAHGLGLQAFVSGEVSEHTTHFAREAGIHYFGAGHHATERYGIAALGAHLASRWSLQHEFIDIDNPV